MAALSLHSIAWATQLLALAAHALHTKIANVDGAGEDTPSPIGAPKGLVNAGAILMLVVVLAALGLTSVSAHPGAATAAERPQAGQHSCLTDETPVFVCRTDTRVASLCESSRAGGPASAPDDASTSLAFRMKTREERGGDVSTTSGQGLQPVHYVASAQSGKRFFATVTRLNLGALDKERSNQLSQAPLMMQLWFDEGGTRYELTECRSDNPGACEVPSALTVYPSIKGTANGRSSVTQACRAEDPTLQPTLQPTSEARSSLSSLPMRLSRSHLVSFGMDAASSRAHTPMVVVVTSGATDVSSPTTPTNTPTSPRRRHFNPMSVSAVDVASRAAPSPTSD